MTVFVIKSLRFVLSFNNRLRFLCIMLFPPFYIVSELKQQLMIKTFNGIIGWIYSYSFAKFVLLTKSQPEN